MSILVSELRLPFQESEKEAIAQARRLTGLTDQTDAPAWVHRVSIDARHGRLQRIYTVGFQLADLPSASVPSASQREQALVAALHNLHVRYQSDEPPVIPCGTKRLLHRPVVVGLGPAGLFAAYMLAKHGYTPLVFERGGSLDERDAAVQAFWASGSLDPDCNIQFGEGGAGAYSDGKLTTRIGDPLCSFVLETLVAHGAPAEITRQAKPHIGTDLLKQVVSALRKAIVAYGGEVRFHTTLQGVVLQDGVLRAVRTAQDDIACERAILAIGHSARDTFASLYQAGVYCEPKPFSVGVRIEHRQHALNVARYGKAYAAYVGTDLPPADYQLSRRVNGRACYSFCMCPGGTVVAAQSESETIVTNGMSYHARDGQNANAALVVSVAPTDFAELAPHTPFGGIALQRQIEQTAYRQTLQQSHTQAGAYRAPCQRVGDFLAGRPSVEIRRTPDAVEPTYPLGVAFGDATACLPSFVQTLLRESLPVFGKTIRGFDAPDALLTAPETRTSSPVRLTRNDQLFGLQSVGLIPCGEGAGYAGGILSAAVDGIRAAFRIMEEYQPG